MRIIIIFITSLIVVSIHAQVVYNFDEGKAGIEDVVECQGVEKSEAYKRAKIWMATNLKSSDQQILSDDENYESLIGTGNLLLPDEYMTKEKTVNFKISIFFKDGRYKYNIGELVFSWVSTSMDQSARVPHMKGLNKEYKKIFSKGKIKKKKLFLEIDAAFEQLTDGLNQAVIAKAPPQSEDW